MPPAEFIELSSTDPDPRLTGDSPLPPLSSSDRRLHAPDRSHLLVRNGTLVGRASCWWSATPQHQGRQVGIIGHYAAVDVEAGEMLLERACAQLAQQGRTIAVGPMDGNTWRRYRFIVERGAEPPFFLEPDNPDEWPRHWTEAGFAPLAYYRSAVNDAPGVVDARTDAALKRLRDEHGITIGPMPIADTDGELARMHELSIASFSNNYLYTPIGRDEFVAQYKAVLPSVRSELVLVAERAHERVGYMFALPDLLRGPATDTVILKTLAVHPSARGAGLGAALLDLAQRSAAALGYRRAIHALFHEQNISGRISGRYARPIRRYALFARELGS